MTAHATASRDEWLTARLELLKSEKALTRAGDELARQRQSLPWVRVEKDYSFDTDEGKKSLHELFRGRSQLIVYHLMFGSDYTGACPSCSMIADGFNSFWEHLAHHDVMLCAVSRAPLEKLRAYKERMGWTFPWFSSFGSDFNSDFGVGFTEQQQDQGYEYNYQASGPVPRSTVEAPRTCSTMCGVDNRTFLRELPGMSTFTSEDGEVYHCYSTYGRGLDALWGSYQWLDRAPLGRNEANGPWWKRRDEYGAL